MSKEFNLPFEDRKKMLLSFWDKLIPHFPSIKDKVNLVISEEPDEDDEYSTGRYWKTKKEIVIHPMNLTPHFYPYDGNVHKFYSKLFIVLIHEIRHAIWDFSDTYNDKVKNYLLKVISKKMGDTKPCNINIRLRSDDFIIAYREIIETDACCFSIKWILDNLSEIHNSIYPEFDTDSLLIEIARNFTYIYTYPTDVRPKPIQVFTESNKEKILELVKRIADKNWFDIFNNINWDSLEDKEN